MKHVEIRAPSSKLPQGCPVIESGSENGYSETFQDPRSLGAFHILEGYKAL
jgi:hypothetical protein